MACGTGPLERKERCLMTGITGDFLVVVAALTAVAVSAVLGVVIGVTAIPAVPDAPTGATVTVAAPISPAVAGGE